MTLPGQKGLNASIEWLKLRSLEVLYTIYSSTGFSNLLDWSWPATALLYSLSYLFVQHSQTRSKQHQNSLKCVNSISKNKFSNLKLPKEISQKIYKSKQGRPPRKSEKGAVRCGWAYVASETTLLLGQIKLKIATAIGSLQERTVQFSLWRHAARLSFEGIPDSTQSEPRWVETLLQ